MKKVLAVVIAVAFISIGAFSSNAQVPNITIYFDDLLQAQQGDCADHFPGEQTLLNVVMNNFNTFVSTVEFATDFGPNAPVTYLGDVHVPSASLFLGTSYADGPGPNIDGVTITYQIPQNAFDPFICLRLNVVWLCDDCGVLPPQPISVVPHEASGNILAIEWQTFDVINGVGMTSLVCPGIVSTEETTWGQVKALYEQ